MQSSSDIHCLVRILDYKIPFFPQLPNAYPSVNLHFVCTTAAMGRKKQNKTRCGGEDYTDVNSHAKAINPPLECSKCRVRPLPTWVIPVCSCVPCVHASRSPGDRSRWWWHHTGPWHVLGGQQGLWCVCSSAQPSGREGNRQRQAAEGQAGDRNKVSTNAGTPVSAADKGNSAHGAPLPSKLGFCWESSQREVSRGSRSGTVRAIKAEHCPALQRASPSPRIWAGSLRQASETGDADIGTSGVSHGDLGGCHGARQAKIGFP